MSELTFVPRGGGGGETKEGTFFVAKRTTGQTVDLGGLPRVIAIFSKTAAVQDSFSDVHICAYPQANQQLFVKVNSSELTIITFTATGFRFSSNSWSQDLYYQYFAIM